MRNIYRGLTYTTVRVPYCADRRIYLDPLFYLIRSLYNPKAPCAPIVHTLALKYPSRDYSKAKVYTIWVHGLLGVYRV